MKKKIIKEEGVVSTEKIPSKVNLNKIYKDKDWKEFENKPIIPLGAETATHNLVGNLVNNFNLIIAGMAGSGKSTFFHSSIINLLRNTKLDEMRFIFISPKQNDFSLYEKLPNLAFPVIRTGEEAKKALAWCLEEIKSRLKLLKEGETVLNVDDYNKKNKKKIPRIVIVIEEYPDLMNSNFDFFEKAVLKILESSCIVAVNILMATSKPSQKGAYSKKLVEAFNFRLAFKTKTVVDSIAIIGVPGAEKLGGKGDMLLMHPNSCELVRLRGFYENKKNLNQLNIFSSPKGKK